MSRRRPASGATISLFPFLAVLLCTMGALLVLLVIFSRRAKESETAATREAEQARREELEAAREDLRWRLEQLRGVRERTQEDLARERMRLAGVEEDARKLADEIDSLERTAAALERGDPAADAGAAADAERRLAAARAALDEARKEGAKRPAAYAVVPYEGASGTHRRPLYIECCLDGVFLQPEGIRLGPADFEGPPGPGNPLASALRAAREHLARDPGEHGDPAAQPYPLLLVRPAGVMAYYAAREALVSWGSEFGYQFVDEDWELTYPPADPALAAVEHRAIEESRRRLEWLAQVRPARPARPTQHYRAATTAGGVVAEGGPSVLGDQSRFDWTEAQAGRGTRGGAGRDGSGNGTGTGSGSGKGSGNGDGAGQGTGDVVLGNGGRGGGSGVSGTGGGFGSAGPGSGPASGGRYAGPSRFYSGQAPDGVASTGGAGGAAGGGPGGGDRPNADGSSGESGGPNVMGAGSGGSATGGGTDANGSDAASATSVGGGGRSAAGGGGAGSGAAGGAAGSAGGSAGISGGGGGASGGPTLPGLPQAAGGMASGGSDAGGGSLAGSRGSNWASLATASRPIPVTRPIRIECAADEFRIFDDTGVRIETHVPIGTRTADAVDPLVQSIHARVGRWGLAGERMYWRPELVLSETVDGGARREDLERLLADSGLDTRRERPDTRVRPLPPIKRTSAVAPRR